MQHLLGVWVLQGDVGVDVAGHWVEPLLLPDKPCAGGVIVTVHEHRLLCCMASQQVHDKDAPSPAHGLARLSKICLQADGYLE